MLLKSGAGQEQAAREPHRAGLASGRTALAAFVALEALALPLMLWSGHRRWFLFDEWDFLALRKAGDLGDLLRPFNGHITTLPILTYRLIWWLVGLRSYTPYLAVVVAAHLVVAALLRAVMRRSGVGPWLSTLAAAIFLFFGSGAANIIVAFQMTFVGALAFGLGWLLLADHEGAIDRRDWLGLVAGIAALLCSGIGIVMLVVVGAATLSRRGWRIALFHTAPVALFFLIISAVAPKGRDNNIFWSSSRAAQTRVVKFVGIGVGSAFGRLGQLPGLGFAIGAVLVIGLVLGLSSARSVPWPGSPAAPIALLFGALVFLVMTGETRGEPPVAARLSRYVYVVVALSLPAIALAAEVMVRRWGRVFAIPVIALLAVGMIGNLAEFANFRRPAAWPASLGIVEQGNTARGGLLTAANLPLAPQLPRSLQPEPYYASGATLGWLLDGRASGRLPSPGPLNPDVVATETLTLALQPSEDPVLPRQCHINRYADPACWPSISARTVRRLQTTQPASCRAFTSRRTLVMARGHAIKVEQGSIDVVYEPVGGGRSTPRRLSPGTVVALAGPLPLLISPDPAAPGGSAVVCI